MTFHITNPKLFQIDDLKHRMASWRIKDDRIVFTNGCFDVLHPGHVKYLADAKKLGHRLVVAINSDESVRRLEKGTGRPFNTTESRAYVIAGLASVDAVIIFSEDTPLDTIRTIKPDVLAKGGDYDASVTDVNDPRYIVGSAEVKAWGGEVHSIPFVEGFSTTALVEKIQSL